MGWRFLTASNVDLKEQNVRSFMYAQFESCLRWIVSVMYSVIYHLVCDDTILTGWHPSCNSIWWRNHKINCNSCYSNLVVIHFCTTFPPIQILSCASLNYLQRLTLCILVSRLAQVKNAAAQHGGIVLLRHSSSWRLCHSLSWRASPRCPEGRRGR
jgi:hypothetical protein